MKIEKKSPLYLVLVIITTILAAMIIFPLLDFLWSKFITRSEFNYSIMKHIIDPIIFGCIFGLITWIIDRRKK